MAIRKASTNGVVSGVRGNIAVKATKLDGNLAQTDNIFMVTGAVEVLELYAVATTVTHATVCTGAYMDLYDGTNSPDITDSAGTNLSGLTVGSVFGRFNSAASAIGLIDADQARVAEGGTDMLHYKFMALQKAATTTYIRLLFTGNASTDIDVTFYCRYRPLSENGAVTPV